MIDVNALVTHRMPFLQFEDAMQLAMSGECGKVILDF